MTARRWLIPVLVITILMTAACGSSGGPPKSASTKSSAPDTIVIKNFTFYPSSLTVTPGATVTVHNEDVATHTVTANDNQFNTGDVTPGSTKTFAAPTKPGSYGYICEIHQYMTGTLVVS